MQAQIPSAMLTLTLFEKLVSRLTMHLISMLALSTANLHHAVLVILGDNNVEVLGDAPGTSFEQDDASVSR